VVAVAVVEDVEEVSKYTDISFDELIHYRRW
jgi:hypothetical protein